MTSFWIYTALLTFCTTSLSAIEPLSASHEQVSEAFGYFIWSEQKKDQASAPLSLDSVIEGMRMAEAGKPCPIAKDKLQERLMQFEEDHYNALASKNLARAEQFLDEVKMNSTAQEIVPRRLYIQILSSGTSNTIQIDKPSYNIKCALLDGQELVNTFRTGIPVTQDLNTAVKGFKEGVAGMKVKEKRRLYIHPEYGYGTLCHIEPNSLLIVDVEYLPSPK